MTEEEQLRQELNFTQEERCKLLNGNYWSKYEVRCLIRDCECLEKKLTRSRQALKAKEAEGEKLKLEYFRAGYKAFRGMIMADLLPYNDVSEDSMRFDFNSYEQSKKEKDNDCARLDSCAFTFGTVWMDEDCRKKYLNNIRYPSHSDQKQE